MKTAEEHAKEYADIIDPVIVSGTNITCTIDELNEFAQMDYLAGYLKAIMWRDPDEELPDEGVDVLVKISSVIDGEFDYYVDCVISDDTGCRWFKRHGDNAIGWRPIE